MDTYWDVKFLEFVLIKTVIILNLFSGRKAIIFLISLFPGRAAALLTHKEIERIIKKEYINFIFAKKSTPFFERVESELACLQAGGGGKNARAPSDFFFVDIWTILGNGLT